MEKNSPTNCIASQRSESRGNATGHRQFVPGPMAHWIGSLTFAIQSYCGTSGHTHLRSWPSAPAGALDTGHARIGYINLPRHHILHEVIEMESIYTTDINNREIDALFYQCIRQLSIDAHRASAHARSIRTHQPTARRQNAVL
jgi:hypothetical protein